MMSDKEMPWEELTKNRWLIVGMNHYRLKGVRHLFCSMARKGHCITAENTSESEVFAALSRQASQLDDALTRPLDDFVEKASWFDAGTDVVSIYVAKSQLSDVVTAVQKNHNAHIARLTSERSELVETLEGIKAGCEDDEAFRQHGWVFEIIDKALS